MKKDILNKMSGVNTILSDSDEPLDFGLADGLSFMHLQPGGELSEPFSFMKEQTEAANNWTLYALKKTAKKLKQVVPLILNTLNGREKVFQSINVTGITATPEKRVYTVGIEKENHKKVSLTFSVKANEIHKNEAFHIFPEGAIPVFEDERAYKYLTFLNLFTWRLQEIKTVLNIIIDDPHNPSLQDRPIKKSYAIAKKERINLIFRDPHSKYKDLHHMADSIVDGSKSGFNSIRSVFTKMLRSKSAPIILDANSQDRCFIHFKEHQ